MSGYLKALLELYWNITHAYSRLEWARKMSGSNFYLNSDFHVNLGILYMA